MRAATQATTIPTTLTDTAPGQLAILELDQSTSTQVINTAIGVLLFAGLIYFLRSSR